MQACGVVLRPSHSSHKFATCQSDRGNDEGPDDLGCFFPEGQRRIDFDPDFPALHGDEAHAFRVASRYVPLDPNDRMMKPHAVRALMPQLRERRYDPVHIQTPFVAHYLCLEIADALGLPRMETYHTFFEDCLYHYVPVLPRSVLRELSRRFSRMQCNRMSALVVPSSAMRDKLAE